VTMKIVYDYGVWLDKNLYVLYYFFFQAEDGIRDFHVTGVQTCALPISRNVLVIVDSVTALLKGCASESDERRQSHEILHRLRTLFGEPRLALTILLAEQDFSENPNSRRSEERRVGKEG